MRNWYNIKSILRHRGSIIKDFEYTCSHISTRLKVVVTNICSFLNLWGEFQWSTAKKCYCLGLSDRRCLQKWLLPWRGWLPPPPPPPPPAKLAAPTAKRAPHPPRPWEEPPFPCLSRWQLGATLVPRGTYSWQPPPPLLLYHEHLWCLWHVAAASVQFCNISGSDNLTQYLSFTITIYLTQPRSQ